MEVAGRAPADKSTVEQTILCNPCLHDDEENHADGYCPTCQEYLCSSCIRHHRRSRLSRHHTILDKAAMPKNQSSSSQPDTTCTEPCEQHPDKFIEFYCLSHKEFGCSVCTTVNHRACDIEYIPDAVKSLKSGEEFNRFTKTIEDIETTIEQYKAQIGSNLESVNASYESTLNEIQKFRREINAYLDKMEKYLLDKLRDIKRRDEKRLEMLRSECKNLECQAARVKQDLKEKEKNLSRLYTFVKKENERIDQIASETIPLKDKLNSYVYCFQPNSALKTFVSSNTPLGNVQDAKKFSDLVTPLTAAINPFRMKLTECGRIDCQTQEDKNLPAISGMALVSNGVVIAADYSNNSLKMIDISQKKVVSRLDILGQPLDLTGIPEDQAAVTIWDKKKIQIVTLKNQLASRRSFSVNGTCQGIAYVEGKLIVTFPGKVEIMDMQGSVVHTLSNDTQKKTIFADPISAVKAYTGSNVYVTDYNTNMVTKVSVGGKVVEQFQDSRLDYPLGITVLDDRHLALCLWKREQIVVLKDDGNRMSIVHQWPCVSYPRAIVYEASKQVLIVSNGDSTNMQFISLYKLT